MTISKSVVFIPVHDTWKVNKYDDISFKLCCVPVKCKQQARALNWFGKNVSDTA